TARSARTALRQAGFLQRQGTGAGTRWTRTLPDPEEVATQEVDPQEGEEEVKFTLHPRCHDAWDQGWRPSRSALAESYGLFPHADPEGCVCCLAEDPAAPCFVGHPRDMRRFRVENDAYAREILAAKRAIRELA